MIKDFKAKSIESDAQLVKLGTAARVGPSLSFLQNSGTISPGSERLKQSSQMQQRSSSSAPSNVDQTLSDMVNDIRKGKYHSILNRMHKIFTENAHLKMTKSQQISLFRRYIECVRKLSKRYFAQAGLTRQQVQNLTKMCEKGANILEMWEIALSEIIIRRQDINQEQPLEEQAILECEDLQGKEIKESNHLNVTMLKMKLEKELERRRSLKIVMNLEFHIQEFFKATTNLLQITLQLSKSTEYYSFYILSLHRGLQWPNRISSTKDEDLSNLFARFTLEAANQYFTASQIKESVKYYEMCLDILYKELNLRDNPEKQFLILKKTAKEKLFFQHKLIINIVMMVCVLFSLSQAEELLENYSRMLEALRLALWLSKSFCANSYPELDEMIIKAYENAKQKYLELVLEEGEIHVVMQLALQINSSYNNKKNKRSNNKITTETDDDNMDFNLYYSQILYDKYHIKELNESLAFAVPYQRNSQQSQQSQHNITSPHNESNFCEMFSGLQSTVQSKPATIQEFFISTVMDYSKQKQARKRFQTSFQEDTTLQYKVDQNYSNREKNSSLVFSTHDEKPNESKSKQFSAILNLTTFSAANLESSSIVITDNQRSSSKNKNNKSFSYQKQLNSSTQKKEDHFTSTDTANMLTSSSPLRSIKKNKTEPAVGMLMNSYTNRISASTRIHQAIQSNQSNRISQSELKKINQPTIIIKPSKPITTITNPSVLTTKKYFEDSQQILYSEQKNTKFFDDSTLAPQKPKQEQPFKYASQSYSYQQKKDKPVKNLEFYFSELINKNIAKQDTMSYKTTNMNFDIVSKGIQCIMKDESFDKEEFSMARRHLNLKMNNERLIEHEKDSVAQIRISTHNEIGQQIEDSETQEHLKQQLINSRSFKKAIQNKNRTSNILSEEAEEETSTKDSTRMRSSTESFQKNNAIQNQFKDTRKEKGMIKARESFTKQPYPQINQTDLDFSHQAKKEINSEIELLSQQMTREEEETRKLLQPKQSISSCQINQPQGIQISKKYDSQDRISLKKAMNSAIVCSFPDQNHSMNEKRLKFLDEYKAIAESTQTIPSKRGTRKFSIKAEAIINAQRLSKLIFERSKLKDASKLAYSHQISSTENNHSARQIMGKSNMDIQKSIMKLMRLQTTDMTEKNQ